MEKKNISYLYAFAAILIWGSSAAISKLAVSQINPLQILLVTTFFAFTTIFIIVLLQKKLSEIKNYNAKDLTKFAALGFLGIFFYDILYYSGMAKLPAQIAMSVNAIWPIMVVIFGGIFLKERITLKNIAGILLSFFGVVLVITKDDFSIFLHDKYSGAVYSFIGAVFYGLFSVFCKKQNHDSSLSLMFYFGFGFIYSLIAVVLFSEIPKMNTALFLELLWMGSGMLGLGYLAWLTALKLGDTAKIANLILLSPFLSLIYIYFLTGEVILLSSVMGLALIVGGILVQNYRVKEKQKQA